MIEFDTNKQRRFVRHPSSIPVDLSDLGTAPICSERIMDVSCGGLSCQSTTRFAEGHLVSLGFPSLSGNQQLTGRVVWCRKSRPLYEVGIEFQSADAIHTMRMFEQICHIQEYHKLMLEKEGRELSIDDAALEWIKRNSEQFPE